MEIAWYFLQKSQRVLKKSLSKGQFLSWNFKRYKRCCLGGGSRYPIKGSMKVCGGHGVCGGGVTSGVFSNSPIKQVLITFKKITELLK